MASCIPQNIINTIIDSSDIVDIISENVSLKQKGSNFIGLCPFHAEKTPSFTVSTEKQIYYCFGCGQGGNVFSFLMKHEGLSFPEAVSNIAKRSGILIPVKHINKEELRNLTLFDNVSSINLDAMTFFHQNLIRFKSDHPVRSYLTQRGININTVEKFKIGYAPKTWHSLEEYLIKKKWRRKLIATSGLTIVKKDTNNSYDRFRNRVIFPIFDTRSNVIGFGGRVIDESMPKYLNSPETPIYKKSKSIYGINIAKKDCINTKTVFVVEGYLDLITLHQVGIKNSVATLGTSITVDQIRQIKGFIGKLGKVILVYDSDQAGIKAAHRSLDIFQREAVNVNIMILPTGYDPDSFIMEFGPEKFIIESKKAITGLSFMIDLGISKNGLSINGKIKIVNELKHFIANNDNALSRTLSIQYLAERINVDELLVQKEVNNYITKLKKRYGNYSNREKYQNENSIKNRRDFNKTYRLEHQILAMMLQFPDMVELVKSKDIICQFGNKSLRTIAEFAISTSPNKQHYLNNIVEACKDENEKSLVAKLALTGEKWDKKGCMLLIKQFEGLVSKNNNLMKKIAEAEQNGNDELLSQLLQEKQQLARVINKNAITRK